MPRSACSMMSCLWLDPGRDLDDCFSISPTLLGTGGCGKVYLGKSEWNLGSNLLSLLVGLELLGHSKSCQGIYRRFQEILRLGCVVAVPHGFACQCHGQVTAGGRVALKEIAPRQIPIEELVRSLQCFLLDSSFKGSMPCS